MSVRTGLGFLLDLAGEDIGEDAAARVRERLGVEEDPSDMGVGSAVEALLYEDTPVSVLQWLLERDEPEINAMAFHHPAAGAAVKRDILRGVPFGPGDRPPLECPEDLEYYDEPEIPAASSPYGVVGTLRRAGTMRQAKSAALAVSREHWAEIAAADRAEPLPGHARWALAVRFDCPPPLRAQFGSHPKFAHRLRRAGLVEGPREYVERWRPARTVLGVLDLGRVVFPDRVREAADALRPPVRERLGGDAEAWAVLAQLLPTFTGTLPELVATAGAVARGTAA